MGKPCMVEVNSKEEKEQLEKNTSFTVEMFHSHECPHCKQMKPIVEDKCNEVQKMSPSPDLVKFIDCPVNKDFCKDEAVALGAKGIPFIIGKPRGQKPVFTVEGARPNDFNENIEKIKRLIDQTKQAAGPQGASPPSLQAPPSMYMPPQAASMPDADNKMHFKYDDSHSRSQNATALCTPGVTCNQEEYNARLATFIGASKSKRDGTLKL